MISSAEMGNKTAMVTDKDFFREKQCPHYQIVSKTPLFEPSQRVMGKQDGNFFPVRPNFMNCPARMVMDRDEPVSHVWITSEWGRIS